MSRPPTSSGHDDLPVVWDWHRGLLRRATLALTLYALVGPVAILIGAQPISHHDEQLRLLALADIHRAELSDFQAVARVEQALHSGAAGNGAQDILEPLRAHLRRIDPVAAQLVDPTIGPCLARWDEALSHLQAPTRRPAAAAGPESAPFSSGSRTLGGDAEILLEDLVDVREGLSAEPQVVKFASGACSGPNASRLRDFCAYFGSIRDGGLVRYEQVADNYTPPSTQRTPTQGVHLAIPVPADPCLNTPNSLRGYRQVAALADGAALVRTLGDFEELGSRIAGQRAALAQQNGGIIAGSPGGFLTVALSQRTSYFALIGLGCLTLIYGHYHLRRLGDLLSWIPKEAVQATYRLWPHFMPVFMSPVASVQFDRPAHGDRVAGWTHALFKLLDALPAFSFVLQLLSAVALVVWSVLNPSASAGFAPTLLGAGALLALQLLVLADYLRERRDIAAWIAARNPPASSGPASSPPAQGASHAK